MTAYIDAEIIRQIKSLQEAVGNLTSSVNAAVMTALQMQQGTTSPDGVVTGYVADQQYLQYSATTHEVEKTWQFRGVIGTKTGWTDIS